jgi:bifunctional non-homologous end joining protein LigD
MVDQLSLRLDPQLPHLPLSLRPMTAVPSPEPFDSANHLFEPSWGGARVLAFVEADERSGRTTVRILDEAGDDLAPVLPELKGLGERFESPAVVVDGELLVVDRMGRCDPLALANRLRGKPGPSVVFLAFDLLYRDARPLLGQALTKRRDQLRRTIRPGPEALALPAIAGEGRALYAAVVDAGLAGVTGRVLRSPYLPGIRSRLWRFVPARRDPNLAPEGASSDADLLDEPSAGPVLALIRRLPLDDG